MNEACRPGHLQKTNETSIASGLGRRRRSRLLRICAIAVLVNNSALTMKTGSMLIRKTGRGPAHRVARSRGRGNHSATGRVWLAGRWAAQRHVPRPHGPRGCAIAVLCASRRCLRCGVVHPLNPTGHSFASI